LLLLLPWQNLVLPARLLVSVDSSVVAVDFALDSPESFLRTARQFVQDRGIRTGDRCADQSSECASQVICESMAFELLAGLEVELTRAVGSAQAAHINAALKAMRSSAFSLAVCGTPASPAMVSRYREHLLAYAQGSPLVRPSCV
jgi:hypothetical protein